MGFYIQTPMNLSKAQYLADTYSAEILSKIPTWCEDKAIICIVNNGAFEAAAYCYSRAEFEAFSYPTDVRKKCWLYMDKAIAQKLSGYI